MMLVHGRLDERVDLEHSRRLSRMLPLAGRPPAEPYFDEEHHGVEDPANRTLLWKRALECLDRSTR